MRSGVARAPSYGLGPGRLFATLQHFFVADAHRDGKRFVVRADELLTVFLELESAILA
jgi:hypothetical protein